MELSKIEDTFKIDMVQTALGCPEACLHCGAYANFNAEDLKLRELSSSELERNIMVPVKGTRKRLAQYFNKYITTDVNTEPLRGDIFLTLAERVHAATEGRSRVCAISHGIRTGNKAMTERLKAIVALMKQKVIPLIVISMDCARSKGKISAETNFESYTETLEILRSAFRFGRVTISLQGERNPLSPLWIGRTHTMWEALQKTLSFTSDELRLLVVDARSYTRVGRAEAALGMTDSEDCDVIPDQEFVEKEIVRDHRWRGMIRFDGAVMVAPNRPGKTYGDSVNPLLWQRLDTEEAAPSVRPAAFSAANFVRK